VLALSLAGLSFWRWRQEGDDGDLRVGAAVLLFGALPVVACSVLFSDTPVPTAIGEAERLLVSTGLVVGLVLLVWRLLPWRKPSGQNAAAAVAALTAGVAVLLLALPGVVDILASPLTVPPRAGGQVMGQVLLGAVWMLLAGMQWRRAGGKELQAPWLAMTFAALGQSRLALALSLGGGSIWLTGSQLLRLEAVLMALAGVNYHLATSFTRERLKVMASMATVQSMESERASERAANEERVHDIRAALFVIRGAAEMLHQHCNELDSETVTTLAQALASEVTQVQALTSARTPQPLQAVRLRDVLDPLILCEAQARTRVTSDIGDVLALGRPADVAEVVRNLLDNVRRHAPGSPVHVEALVGEGGVRVCVEDRGPGIPSAERTSVLERGVRGSASAGTDGSGLGLYVASRLVDQQGGRLWIEDRPGGGTKVVFTLPVVADPQGTIALAERPFHPGPVGHGPQADVIDLRGRPA
jgi:signal transduction histidine kinase